MKTFINSILAIVILSTSAIAADYNYGYTTQAPPVFVARNSNVKAELTDLEFNEVVKLPPAIKVLGVDLLSRIYAVNKVKLNCAKVWHTVPDDHIQAIIEEESPAYAVTDDILMNVQAGLNEHAASAIAKQAYAQRVDYLLTFERQDLRPLRSLNSQQEWCNVRGYFIIDRALRSFRVDNPGDDSVYKTFVEKKGHYLLALEQLQSMLKENRR